jgi:hypothetical protein
MADNLLALDIDIPSSGSAFEELSRIAAEPRRSVS